MANILDELRAVKIRKLVTTEIEYECETEKMQDEVFDTVREIVDDQTDRFSKITYDIDPVTNKVKVSVIQHV